MQNVKDSGKSSPDRVNISLHSVSAVLPHLIRHMPPLIVHYADGGFELNDGNHRHQVYENLGIEKAWVIIWITEEAERDDFMNKYGEYVKECKVIRR